ncbi:MAG: hypothetical protein ACLSAF_06310 [Intestinimonas sp.]
MKPVSALCDLSLHSEEVLALAARFNAAQLSPSTFGGRGGLAGRPLIRGSPAGTGGARPAPFHCLFRIQQTETAAAQLRRSLFDFPASDGIPRDPLYRGSHTLEGEGILWNPFKALAVRSGAGIPICAVAARAGQQAERRGTAGPSRASAVIPPTAGR